MCSLYKNKDLLKNHPFYSNEIESNKKNKKENSNISLLSELLFFLEEFKELSNKELSQELPFFPKIWKKRKKRLTKYQILSNIPPFFDTARIIKREHAHRGYAETYNVEVMDNRSLNDSLRDDLLREKRGFKYNLVAEITLKRWNNAINRYDIETVFIRSGPATVQNQKFNLEASYKILANILDIWTGFGSG